MVVVVVACSKRRSSSSISSSSSCSSSSRCSSSSSSTAVAQLLLVWMLVLSVLLSLVLLALSLASLVPWAWSCVAYQMTSSRTLVLCYLMIPCIMWCCHIFYFAAHVLFISVMLPYYRALSGPGRTRFTHETLDPSKALNPQSPISLSPSISGLLGFRALNLRFRV